LIIFKIFSIWKIVLKFCEIKKKWKWWLIVNNFFLKKKIFIFFINFQKKIKILKKIMMNLLIIIVIFQNLIWKLSVNNIIKYFIIFLLIWFFCIFFQDFFKKNFRKILNLTIIIILKWIKQEQNNKKELVKFLQIYHLKVENYFLKIGNDR